MRPMMKSKKAQAHATEATRKEEAAMKRRQKQSQKSEGKAAQESRLAVTIAQQSIIAEEAAKDEGARDNATPADINRETTLTRRALVAKPNAMKQLKSRAVRKDKNELDHPSLTKDAKDCLRRAWLDGEVSLSDNRLYSLLCQLLGEAAKETGRKQLVAMQNWTEVISELTGWTAGANKGLATEMGPFQLALVKERTVESNNLPITLMNIIEHWMSILLANPNLNDIAEKDIRSRKISGLSIGLLASTTSRASIMS